MTAARSAIDRPATQLGDGSTNLGRGARSSVSPLLLLLSLLRREVDPSFARLVLLRVLDTGVKPLRQLTAYQLRYGGEKG